MKKYFGFLIVLTLFVLGSAEVHAAASVPGLCASSASPSLTIISPNGGEVYQDGQKIEVKWTSCNISANANVSLTLNFLNGNDHGSMSLFSGSTLNDGTELITLPSMSLLNSIPGKYYTIGIVYNSSFATDKNNSQIRDISDNTFTIKNSNSSEIAPCVPGASAVMLNMKLNPDSPNDMNVYPGTNNLELTRINLINNGTENACLNGIHLGSSFDVNNHINNTRVIDVSTGLIVGQVVNYFTNNGTYYYSWINSKPSLSIKKGETKTFKIVSDFPTTSKRGTFTIGFWGLNFDSPGAYLAPQVVNGNKINVINNSIIDDSSNKITPTNPSMVVNTTVPPNGCSNGEKYSSTNGQICTEYGCLHGEVYSSTTGMACPIKLIEEDKGCSNGEIYSSTTGKACVTVEKSCSINGSCIPQVKTTVQRTLKVGAKGEDVKVIQKFLGLNADGVFGKKTAEKVKEWQMTKNLTADGIVGNKTMSLMK